MNLESHFADIFSECKRADGWKMTYLVDSSMVAGKFAGNKM
ncbi:hypothetical protein ACP_1695 [Acidobacterium capsulatum ATCC 51196]|uniref:Uncharacterized protein n=1 Tax=Acidobacterium capsulatum (strain ATCC 51196 / DSM 11244 / BCRC 80197 / JCM 7670 / NBRC 15755 / NCIMB 13165 / 161) TaxID=240015 RepID=C1F7D9_ACIC5|nr:hypothetical protein ACP_1695 [Acidobacterium capsulatum ATCC 51196]